jgi:hypothetical protein
VDLEACDLDRVAGFDEHEPRPRDHVLHERRDRPGHHDRSTRERSRKLGRNGRSRWSRCSCVMSKHIRPVRGELERRDRDEPVLMRAEPGVDHDDRAVELDAEARLTEPREATGRTPH